MIIFMVIIFIIFSMVIISIIIINIYNIMSLKVTREGGSRKVVPPRWYFRSSFQEIFILRSSISISKGMKMRKEGQMANQLLLQLNIALHFFPGHHHHHQHHHDHHFQSYCRIFDPQKVLSTLLLW